MKVAYSGGEHEVNVGDKFAFWGGDRWEVVKHVSNGMYSPSGIGGTPCFACKSLDEHFPQAMLAYKEDDDTVIFCGDSIAAAMARAAAGKPAGNSTTGESK